MPNGFFGITVNFVIQKLKSKQLVCLIFLWWEVFLRELEKVFRAQYSFGAIEGQLTFLFSQVLLGVENLLTVRDGRYQRLKVESAEVH